MSLIHGLKSVRYIRRTVIVCCVSGSLVSCGGGDSNVSSIQGDSSVISGRVGEESLDLNVGNLLVALGQNDSSRNESPKLEGPDGSISQGLLGLGLTGSITSKIPNGQVESCFETATGNASCSSGISSSLWGSSIILPEILPSSDGDCQKSGVNQVACSSASATTEDDSSSSASAVAIGDIVEVATSVTGNQSSSSSSSSSGSYEAVDQPGKRAATLAIADRRTLLHQSRGTGFYVGMPRPRFDPNEALSTSQHRGILATELVLASVKCDCTSMAALSGRYGFVEIGMNSGDKLSLWSRIAERFVSDDGNVSDLSSRYLSIERFGSSSVAIFRDRVLRSSSSFVLEGRGSLADLNRGIVNGFFNSEAGVWVNVNARTDKVEQEVPALAVGLRLAETAPDLRGDSYRLFAVSMGQSNPDISLGIIGSGELSFSADGEATMRGLVIERAAMNYQDKAIKYHQDSVPIAGATYSILEKGAMDIRGISVNGEEWQLSGFVSGKGDIIVLRSEFLSPNNMLETGLVIGVRI